MLSLKKFFALIAFFLLFLVIGLDVVAKKPHRLVSLKPNITSILIDLKLDDHIVGITRFCPKPQGQAQLVADYNSIDVEAVIRLKPTLVITSKENSQQQQFEVIKEAGIAIKLFDFSTWEATILSYKEIAKQLGVEDVAKAELAIVDKQLQKIRQRFLGQKSFSVIVQRRPLMVATGQTFISTLLSQVGLKNTFENNRIAYPVIDEEVLIREITDYTFEMTHEPNSESPAVFLSKTITPLKIQDFWATPKAALSLQKIFDPTP